MRMQFAKGHAQCGDNSKLRVESIRLVQVCETRCGLVKRQVTGLCGYVDARENVKVDIRK